MSTDATTFPLRDSLLDDPADLAAQGHVLGEAERSRRASASARAERTRRDTAIGASVLIWIGMCVLLIVLAAADRPSFLSSPSHYGFFPHWLAGPLGGLWPWFTRSPRATKSLLTVALVTMYVAYVVGLRYVPLLRARWAIATIVGVHVILLLSPPLSLTDVFNYINYGRMGMLHGLDPYTTIPALGPHSDPSYALSNWHQLLTPYGPLFTLITYAVVPLGLAGSLWTFKGLLMVLSLATILLVWRCARLLGRDPVAAIVLVGLNPLILVWGLGGDHNDFFMMFCIMLAFYLLLRARAPGISPEFPSTPAPSVSASTAGAPGDPLAALAAGIDGSETFPPAHRVLWARVRAWLWPLAAPELGAGVALAAAIALKASAAILVPVILAGLLRAPRRLVQVVLGLIAGGIVLGVCTVVAFGTAPARPRRPGPPGDPDGPAQPARPRAGSGRGDGNDAQPAQRGAGAGGARLQRAGMAPAGRADGVRLGDDGAAADVELGAAVVRAVGAAAGGAVALARAAHHGPGVRGLPVAHVDAARHRDWTTRSASGRRRRCSGSRTSATSAGCWTDRLGGRLGAH